MQYGIYVYGKAYITIAGVTVTNVMGWARIVNLQYIVMRDNHFSDATAPGTAETIFPLGNGNKVDEIGHESARWASRMLISAVGTEKLRVFDRVVLSETTPIDRTPLRVTWRVMPETTTRATRSMYPSGIVLSQ